MSNPSQWVLVKLFAEVTGYRDSAARHRRTGFCEAWASCRNGSWLSGASNIASHCDRRVTMCDK